MQVDQKDEKDVWKHVPEAVKNAAGLLEFIKYEVDGLPDSLYERINDAIHKIECEYF